MQFVPVVFVAIAFLRRALRFFDSTDLLMVRAICVPSLGWLRLIFILRLKTSDRTRTTWAAARQIGTRLAGLNPNPHLHYLRCKVRKLGRSNRSTSSVTSGDSASGQGAAVGFRRQRSFAIDLNLLTASAPRSLRAFEPGAESAARTSARQAS